MKFGDKFYDRLEVRVERAYSQYTFILDFDSRISDRFDHRTRSLDRNIFKNTIPLQILSLSRREGRWFGDLYSHSFESVEKEGGGGRGGEIQIPVRPCLLSGVKIRIFFLFGRVSLKTWFAERRENGRRVVFRSSRKWNEMKRDKNFIPFDLRIEWMGYSRAMVRFEIEGKSVVGGGGEGRGERG